MNWNKFRVFSRRRFIVSGVSSAFVVAACDHDGGRHAGADGGSQPGPGGKADSPVYDPDNGSLQAYADRFSVAPGETIRFMVSSPSATFSVEFVQCGATEVHRGALDAVAGQLQQSPPDAAKVGAGWTPTFEFTIPHEWPNGLYAAKLSSATRKFNVGFVVREADPGTQGRLAVVLSNFTWEVYNKWGGASFYHYELDDGDGVVINATGFQVSPFVSQDRPNPIEGDPIAGARARAERRILQWLESRGYSHAVLCDDDLHRDPSILSAYDAVILNAHPEYYSDNMYDALDDFLDQGGSLAYFGGNGVYWRVTVEGRQIECRKEQDYSERLHTHAAYAGQLGGRWRDIGRPESALLGVEFNEDWYNATHGSSYTPYAVLQPEHWAFAGLDLQTGDTVGSRGRNLWNGSTGGASGFEIDRVTDHSPANIELLAEATGDPAGAHMTYYTHPGGGGVFSGGSIAFGLGLDLDENLATVVENVLDSFLEE